MSQTLELIHSYAFAQITIARAKDRDISSIVDKRDCLLAVAGELSVPNPIASDLVSAVERIFEDTETSPILLSSIHKAKGREWPRVHLLSPELIGKFAKTESQHIQERNIRYVAVTRAQKHLNYIHGESTHEEA